MARKQLERLLSEVAALADRLSDMDDTLTGAELDEMLKVAGSDPAALRKRLHEGIQAIALRIRQAGRPVPQYLLEGSEATAPLESVTSVSHKTALEKLRGWLRGLASGPSVLSTPEGMRVIRAYRKTQDLSGEDARLLDELEAQLKSRSTEGQSGGDQEE